MITSDIDIFLGLDVGKTDHWACAVTKDGTKIWNRTLPNDEARIVEVYQGLRTQGTVLVESGPARDHRGIGGRSRPTPRPPCPGYQ